MRALRFLTLMLLLAAVLAVGAAYVFRLPLATWAVKSAMEQAGLENPSAEVTALSFSGARIENLAAGPAAARDFSFETVEAEFGLRRLLSEKKVEALRVGPGAVRVRIGEDGGVSFAGFETGGDGGGASYSGMPFDRLSLKGVTLAVSAPEGEASGTIDADYDVGRGGEASMALETERLAWRDIVVSGLNGEASADFSDYGAISITADFAADVQAPAANIRDLEASLSGEAASWRDAAAGALNAVEGRARIAFSTPEIEILDPKAQALLSAAQAKAVFGEEVHAAALSGAFDVDFSQESIEARFAGDETLALETEAGASLVLRPQGEAPFLSLADGRQAASFRFALAGEGANAAGGVDALHEGETWRIAAPVDIEAFASDALSLSGSRIDVSATATGEKIDAELALKSGLRRAKLGRLTISDAPFSGGFTITGDLAAQRASIASKNECFAAERVRGVIEEQNLEMRFSGMTLCNGDGPLATVSWNGDPSVAVSGEVSAKDGALSLGETNAKGRPPVVRFDATYAPELKTTVIEGRASGGAMTLNDALDMSGVAGRFDFTLDAEAMSAAATVDRLRVAPHLEKGETKMVAAVLAAGDAALAGDKARFSYTVTTPDGRRLGRGEGVHDMMTAAGETEFSLAGLVFAPNGLQPNKIIPALLGIVDAAQGDMDGTVRFAWSDEGVASGAEFELNNISFSGPTRAVTRTSAVSGSVTMSSLLPPATAGLQTINVGAVDLDALKLSLGVITFELPGDDSIHLAKGEFPWFGGTIGVYDATAELTGRAVIPLRAAGVDLGELLNYVDVEGLSGEGVLSGELPIIFENGKARIENGYFQSDGAGVLRYEGKGTDAASTQSGNAKAAFDLLREFRYQSMTVKVSGALDGDIDFDIALEGTGELNLDRQGLTPAGKGRIPTRYIITLEAPLLALINQARLSQDFRLQYQQMQNSGASGGARPDDSQ